MADTLEELSTDIDFRNGPGLSDRVIYRELFRSGLTLVDMREDGAGVSLSMSHIAARQELRALVAEIMPLPAAQADWADQATRWPPLPMQSVDTSGRPGSGGHRRRPLKSRRTRRIAAEVKSLAG